MYLPVCKKAQNSNENQNETIGSSFKKNELYLKPHQVFKNVFIFKSPHNISQFSDQKNLIFLSSTKTASLTSSPDVQMKSWKNYLKC